MKHTPTEPSNAQRQSNKPARKGFLVAVPIVLCSLGLLHYYLDFKYARTFEERSGQALTALEQAHGSPERDLGPLIGKARTEVRWLQKRLEDTWPWGQWKGEQILGALYAQLGQKEQASLWLSRAFARKPTPQLAELLAHIQLQSFREFVTCRRLGKFAAITSLLHSREAYGATLSESINYLQQYAGEEKSEMLLFLEIAYAFEQAPIQSKNTNQFQHQFVQLTEKYPGDYRPYLYQGFVYKDGAALHHDITGEEAMNLYQHAETSFLKAQQIAPSNPDISLALIELYHEMSQQKDPQQSVQAHSKGMAEIDRLMRIARNRPTGFFYLGLFHDAVFRKASKQVDNDAVQHLDRSRLALQQANKLVADDDPMREPILRALGSLWLEYARQAMDSPESPLPYFQKSFRRLLEAKEIHSSPATNFELMRLQYYEAMAERSRNGDGYRFAKQGLKYAEDLPVELKEEPGTARLLSALHQVLAERNDGDAEKHLALAAQLLEQSMDAHPSANRASMAYSLGILQNLRIDLATDPEEKLDLAQEAHKFWQICLNQPNNGHYAWKARVGEARTWLISAGGPEAQKLQHLDRSQEAVEASMALHPNMYAAEILAWVHLNRAKLAQAYERDPCPEIERMRAALEATAALVHDYEVPKELEQKLLVFDLCD